MPPKACKKCAPLVNDKDGELSTVRGQLTASQGDVSSLKAEVSTQRTELESEGKFRRQLDERIAKAESLDKRRTEESDRLMTEIDALKSECKASGEASGALTQEMQRLKSDRLESQEKLDKSIGEVLVLQGQLAERDANIEVLNEGGAADQRTMDSLSENVAALRRSVLETEGERAHARSEEHAVTRELYMSRHQYSVSEAEVARLRSDLVNAGAEASAATQDDARDRAKIVELRSELAEKNAAMQRTSSQLEEATAGERRLQRAVRGGAMLSRPNMLDPNMCADLQLNRLQREGEAIAKRSLELGLAMNSKGLERTLLLGKTQAEPPTVAVFTDSLSVELAKWQ